MENINQLKQNTTNEKTVSLINAVSALFGKLLKIKEKGRLGNIHSTVKPIALMRYLVKLVTMPIGTRILDPFMGSGSTGVACREEGVDFVGIERDPEYAEIARRRIEE